MKASETVIKVFSLPKEGIGLAVVNLLKEQAEISFKAGQQEVVDIVTIKIHALSSHLSKDLAAKNDAWWQDYLKTRGLK